MDKVPRSLFDTTEFLNNNTSPTTARIPAEDSTDGDPTIMSRAECDAVYQRLVRLMHGAIDFTVAISSVRRGNLRWANNDVTSTGETLEPELSLNTYWYTTNQFDEPSLARALSQLIRKKKLKHTPQQYRDIGSLMGPQHYLAPTLFYERTAAMDATERSQIGRALTAPIKAAGLRAAGYLAIESIANAVYNTNGLVAYAQSTTAQYSVTVRDTQDSSSGWAGVDQNDWARIDAAGITERARQKCVASANPRVIEPGRYVTILEPQAVHGLMRIAVGALDRIVAENGGPYHYQRDETKLGQRLLDSRITITSDPMDPQCRTIPFVPAGWDPGTPIQATSWFTNGVLTNLPYSTVYAIASLDLPVARPDPLGYHMSGGTTSIDEMIATTQRGVLVTRFSNMNTVDPGSLLSTGVTRDGFWLVEHGKISYAIKNFRFNESPLFAFNQVEQLGEPVRVFSPGAPAVVPPVKVRDFNFTALIDAV